MLTLVGTGYNVSGQITPDAAAAVRRADRLFYLVNDPATAAVLTRLNETGESLVPFYRQGEPVRRAFAAMAERILSPLGDGLSVCAAFVGHPAVNNPIARETVRQAGARGIPVHLLPGISHEDCLIAELGWSPGRGRVLRSATDFLVRRRPVDPEVALVLTGVGTIGETLYRGDREPNRPGLRLLCEALGRHYPPDHRVAHFETALFPMHDPVAEWLPLRDLAGVGASVASILLIPPRAERPSGRLQRGLGPLPRLE